jgi:hypothetical protein
MIIPASAPTVHDGPRSSSVPVPSSVAVRAADGHTIAEFAADVAAFCRALMFARRGRREWR